MHQQIIKEIVDEISTTLTGHTLARIYQLSPYSLALAFRSIQGSFLFVSADPSLPRIHFISRRVRDLEKQSSALSTFGQALRSNLNGAKLISVKQDESERIVRFTFARREETGELREQVLVAQLTGRSANLLLLNEEGCVTHSLRSLKGSGQQIGADYEPPARSLDQAGKAPLLERGSFGSLSEAADDFYRRLEAAKAFDREAGTARNRLRQPIARLKKLEKHLQDDLAAHGDAEEHKRVGDLLLANLATASRHGNKVTITDFYSSDTPRIEIDIDENRTLQEEAARYFARYTKAKRAIQQIARRLEGIIKQQAELEGQLAALELIVAQRDAVALEAFPGQQSRFENISPGATKQRSSEKIPGTRRYFSSDGYEIMVGRAAKDNDHLTFRVARSNDLWLHAADYPGSHVIVRNPNRKEIPPRTLIEAAQLAAKFSQASNDPKVDVHYTQRKYVAKIKGAAPGLVRLSSFRTLTVEPKESVQRA